MRTDIENKEQNKEQVKEQNKEQVKEQNKEQVKVQNKEQKKEPKKELKKEKDTTYKEHPSIMKNFIGKEITITLRSDNKIKGKLETVAQYEIVITVAYNPMIVMKHAIDYIELTGEK